ncbi:MAG: hypothetical protein ACREKG_10495 [Candidatus Rokuibacteriota bacterium]
MVFKWALIVFAVAALALFVLTKVIAFLNPPRPGRPAPPILGRVRRALTWTVLVPAALALVLLAVTLLRQP